MSGCEESVDEMGADEPGAAGDEIGGHDVESILNFESQISDFRFKETHCPRDAAPTNGNLRFEI